MSEREERGKEGDWDREGKQIERRRTRKSLVLFMKPLRGHEYHTGESLGEQNLDKETLNV